MSTRRTLICAIAGALLAAASAGPGKVYRIGWLSSGPWAGTQPLEVFNQGMRELGWVEGRHYMVDNRYTEGRSERIAAHAADLVQRKVDLLVGSGTPHTAALKNATATIPILFYAVGDPVGSGLVASLARPGGNVTGLGGLGPGAATKQLGCSGRSSRKRRVSRPCSIQESRSMQQSLPKSSRRRALWASRCDRSSCVRPTISTPQSRRSHVSRSMRC